MDIQTNYPLQSLNTFGMKASAAAFAEIKNREDVVTVYQSPFKKIRVLGGGSNILLLNNLDGLVLLNRIKGREIIEESEQQVLVAIGGGENWHETVSWAVNQDFGGLENLSLIPGTVGAAPIQNIGAYGVELKDVFHSLEAFDFQSGQFQNFSDKDCAFGYRYSLFKEKKNAFRYFITKVVLKLTKPPHTLNCSYGAIKATLSEMGISDSKITIKDVGRAVESIRRSKLPDPSLTPNAGSFFKNPLISKDKFEQLKNSFPGIVGYPQSETTVKIAAGWLIEAAGWKGKRIGHVGCHHQQALVLVNYDGEEGREIFDLARAIQSDIHSLFGIKLEPEVNYWS